jgi:transposase
MSNALNLRTSSEMANRTRSGNRCQMILLKSEHRTSWQVAQVLGGCAVVVDNWVKRYEAGGIKDLQARPAEDAKRFCRLLIWQSSLRR